MRKKGKRRCSCAGEATAPSPLPNTANVWLSTMSVTGEHRSSNWLSLFTTHCIPAVPDESHQEAVTDGKTLKESGRLRGSGAPQRAVSVTTVTPHGDPLDFNSLPSGITS
ncbi:hypothetical protein F2P81_013071 [Scophthalmus maximus]|uniref:Uncharacterized protein n=1 Tax=Scophthalmus maximus TaxID=52904 RepID=A0A6A4SMR3_SCOMX|nr:hypothetical protein F2P81_013071 [Scophthalmus maximus]